MKFFNIVMTNAKLKLAELRNKLRKLVFCDCFW